nr:hypothetical protein [Micromonospora sp. DSM 115978]
MGAYLRLPGAVVLDDAVVNEFRLVRPPVLAGATVQRDDRLRLDEVRQAANWADARVVVVDRSGRSAVDWTPSP